MTTPTESTALDQTLTPRIHGPGWRRLAACRFLAPVDGEAGPHWWYPEKESGQGNHGDLAKAVCRCCPVRADCLAVALEVNEEHGIHGGAGEARRRALRRAMAQGPVQLAAAVAAHWRNLDGRPAAGDGALLAVFGEGATHGRQSTYAKGCRGDDGCEACAAAIAEREIAASLSRRRKRPASARSDAA